MEMDIALPRGNLPVLPHLRKISGPVSYSLFDIFVDQGSKYDTKHRLHIFGDRHDRNTICDDCGDDCIRLDDLIQYVAERAVAEFQKIDIFMEIPFQLGSEWKHPPMEGMMYDIYNKFPGCFSKDKSRCECLSYVRFHYIDIRQHVTGGTLITLLSSLLDLGIKRYNTDTRLYAEVVSWIELIFRLHPSALFDIYIGDDNGRELLTRIMKNFTYHPLFKANSGESFRTFKEGLSVHKIRYSLLMMDTDLMGKLYSFSRMKYIKALETVIQVLNAPRHLMMMDIINRAIDAHPGHSVPGRNIDLRMLARYPEETIDLATSLLKMEAIFMDTYALARYFRSWKWNSPKLAIMYVGAAHAETYKEFIEDWLKVLPLETDGDTENDMTTNRQCLINNRYQSIFIDHLFS